MQVDSLVRATPRPPQAPVPCDPCVMHPIAADVWVKQPPLAQRAVEVRLELPQQGNWLQRLGRALLNWLRSLRDWWSGSKPQLHEHPGTELAAEQLKSHPLTDLSSDDESVLGELPNVVDVPPSPSRIAFVAQRTIDTPLERLADIILNIERGPEWIERCIESRVVSEDADGMTLYHRYRAPLVRDRDSVVRLTQEHLSPTVWRLEMHRTECAEVPELNDVVRLPTLDGAFTLTERDGKTCVEYALDMQLGGRMRGLLGWLAKHLQRSLPANTLQRLNDLAK